MTLMTKKWRPENWPRIKQKLAATPHVWGTAMPMVSHEEQIIEATADAILEEFLNLATSEEKENGETDQVRDNEQAVEPEKPV